MKLAVAALVIAMGLVGYLLLPTATDPVVPTFELQQSASYPEFETVRGRKNSASLKTTVRILSTKPSGGTTLATWKRKGGSASAIS